MQKVKKIWKKWLKTAYVIGNFQSQVIFTLFYLIILFPVGIAISFFSDPLSIKQKPQKSNFTNWEHPVEDIDEAKKQY